MKVAFVVLEDFPGSENRVQRQALSMLEAGHEVRIFCARGPSTETEWNGVKIERSLVRREKRSTTRRRLWEYAAFPVATLGFCARAAAWGANVVQVANPPDWLAITALPARIAGARVVLDMHDAMPELMSARGGSTLVRRALEALEGMSVRSSDLVISTTNAMCQAVEARHGSKVVLVPNAVDNRTFPMIKPSARPHPEGPAVVAYHGTLTERFGVHNVVEAVAILRARGLAVVGDIFGDGDARPGLEELARELGVADHVRFHGQVPATSLPMHLAPAAVGVVPYEDSEFMRIAYSTKAFEYAALGIPLVMADLPSLHEQMADGGLWATAGNPNSFADGIEQILLSKDRGVSIAERAQARLAEYQWADWSGPYVDCLVELASA